MLGIEPTDNRALTPVLFFARRRRSTYHCPLDRKIVGSGALAINRFHLVVESLDDRERQHACDEFGGHADLISDDNREPPHTVPVECDFPYVPETPSPGNSESNLRGPRTLL